MDDGCSETNRVWDVWDAWDVLDGEEVAESSISPLRRGGRRAESVARQRAAYKTTTRHAQCY
jgi:hypothetical protein